MSLLTIYGTNAFIILGLMAALWLLSLWLKDASIVDIFWGVGFVLSAWIYFYLTPDGFLTRKILVASLATIWGLRLSIYLLIRNWGHAEDFRYQEWRQESGKNWWWISFFKVFALQGFLMWVISIPLLAAQFSPVPARLIWLDYLGLLVWAIGFFFEAVGDWQLSRFKANPNNQGKLLNTGVWRYTRHPNYFGDAAQWWGFYFIAAAAGGVWSIFSPIIMTLLLRNISGVSMLEKTLMINKPGYQEYVETTHAFIPWLPKQVKPSENQSE
jgi:steroid 5-alpha reductase family enzyme